MNLTNIILGFTGGFIAWFLLYALWHLSPEWTYPWEQKEEEE